MANRFHRRLCERNPETPGATPDGRRTAILAGWLGAWEARVHPETGEQVGPWFLPRSVVRCLGSAWSWVVELPTGELVVAPYVCGSWRCPLCAWQPARDLCERLRLTIAGKDLRDMVFVTLTLPRTGSPWEAMRELGRMSRLLWKRVRYDLGVGVGRQRLRAPLAWVMVFEAHRDPRWLHGHALVWSKDLAARLRRDGWWPTWNAFKGRTERRWRYACRDDGGLSVAARAVGFGRIDAQPVETPEAIAQYLSKLSRELSGGDRKGQLPLLAPRHFRRVRCTPGFLQKLEPGSRAVAAELVRVPADVARDQLLSGDERLSGTLRRLARASVRALTRLRWSQPRNEDPTHAAGQT